MLSVVVVCVWCVCVCVCCGTLKKRGETRFLASKTPPCVHSKRPRVCRHHAHMYDVQQLRRHPTQGAHCGSYGVEVQVTRIVRAATHPRGCRLNRHLAISLDLSVWIVQLLAAKREEHTATGASSHVFTLQKLGVAAKKNTQAKLSLLGNCDRNRHYVQ